MNRKKMLVAFGAVILAAISGFAQDRTTGSIKGKVRLKGEGPVGGVTVSLRQKDREISHVVTNGKGEFELKNLTPGSYGLTFRKPGLSMGALEDVVVKAGKTNSLPDRLILTVNEASIAKLAGSVFNANGFSVPNIRVELLRVEADGNVRRIDSRITNESGQFVFRLLPDKAMYRVATRISGTEPKTQDVEIDGAMVYRVALTIDLPPK